MLGAVETKKIIKEVADEWKSFFDELEMDITSTKNYGDLTVYGVGIYARKHALVYDTPWEIKALENEEIAKWTISKIIKRILKDMGI